MIDIEKVSCLMHDLGVAQKQDLIGVSDCQITELEAFFDLRFPTAYRKYLLAFGRSAGYLSPWLAIYFDDLKEIREQFELLNITHNNAARLPQDTLLIANWESVFDYLICDGAEDPIVYRLDLCGAQGPSSRRYASCFSEYLEKLVRSTDTAGLPQDFFEEQSDEGHEDLIRY